MRVSDSTIYGSLIFYLQQARSRQANTQLQISSGKRLNAPSDNPIDFARAADYKTILATVEQRERGAQFASGQLAEVDSALNHAASNILPRVKELAVSMVNATNGASERAAAAAEIRGIIGQILDVANRKVGDRALFTGSTTRGRLAGLTIAAPAATAPLTITAGSNDTLSVTVDGVPSGTITLAAGNYTSGSSLAAAIQTGINADAILAGQGKAVTVSFDTDHLTIASNSSGAASSVTVGGGKARTVLGLAGGTLAVGANPFTIGVQTQAGARNTGGAVIAPGEVTDPDKLTYGDYLVKFTGGSAFNLYRANSPVSATPSTTNTGGGIVTKNVVNDTSRVTLDTYQVQIKNIYTVTAGANDGIRFDPGTGAVTATLAAGSYTGAQVAAQIKSALEAVAGGKTYTVSYDETTAKFSITNDVANGTALSLLYSNAASTAKSLLGSAGVDQAGIAAGGTSVSVVDTTGAAGVTKQSNVADTTLGTNVFNITSANNTLIVNDTAGGAGADTVITLTTGSYTGAQLATELAARLNTNRNAANTTAYTAAYGSVTTRRFTINDPAGNANSLILKFGDSRSTAAQILGSTPVTVTETVGASATTLNSDAGNTLYASEGAIDFDGLRIAVKDGGSPVRNGDVFTVNQNAPLLSSNQFASGASIAFDGMRFAIDSTGAGASAPSAGDIFRVLTTHLYTGDSADSAIEIGDNLTAQTLVNGGTVFAGSNGGTDLFTAMQSFMAALLSNNVDGIQAAHASFDAATAQVVTAQGLVGARANRLSGVLDGLAQYKGDAQTLLSGTEDVDITKAASDLALQQVTLQAAASSASFILRTSLLDYLK